MRRARFGLAALTTALLAGGAVAARTIAAIDLSRSFGTRAPWRLTAVQADEIDDPISEGRAPGAITLCLSKDDARHCTPDLQRALAVPDPNDRYGEAHFLRDVRIVHPRADRPLLLVQVGSLHSADGGQRIATQLLAYERRRDAFVRLFANQTGHNNNQETRYIAAGPLRGAVIVAEPTEDAPFAFWLTVHRPNPAFSYRQVLRLRSATRYGDGNPLAVIDSEMPNVLRQLGLWHRGQPLPLPAGQCPRPHLVNTSLWCA